MNELILLFLTVIVVMICTLSMQFDFVVSCTTCKMVAVLLLLASTKWPATAAVYKQKLCPKIILGLKTVSEKEIYEIMDSLGLGGYHNLHEVLKLLQLTTFTEKVRPMFP